VLCDISEDSRDFALIGSDMGEPKGNRAFSESADLTSKERANEKPTLIIVEDDFLIASDLEYELKAAGYDVLGIAATSQEAVELARAKRPSMAVVDIRLAEGSDGIEAAIEMYRELNIRSVFASAHVDAATQKRGEPCVPLGWVAKPYLASSIIKMLNTPV
jgi:two-component system, response regulator PdtaR